MKHVLILLALCSTAYARPPAGELPSDTAIRAQNRELRYNRAYAHCSGTPPQAINYCMAITLVEIEFCRKPMTVTTRENCEKDVRKILAGIN